MQQEVLDMLVTGGRNTLDHGVLYLGWAGSYAEFRTDSPYVRLVLRSDADQPDGFQTARVAVEADGGAPQVKALNAEASEWEVIFPDPGQTHHVRVTKITEVAFGLAGIEEIRLAPGCRFLPPESPLRRIEFIGDSITCGYGVEASAKDTFSTATENALLSYATLTARAFGAGFDLVAWSGTGLISRWVPPEAEEPNRDLLMMDLYEIHDLETEKRLGLPPADEEISGSRADLVVINIGTNDFSWTRGRQEWVEAFGKAYQEFLEKVRRLRPGVPVLCTLGILGQALCPEIRNQVEHFRIRHPEAKIRYLEFPVQLPEDGMGADGHPSRITQRKAAELLTAAVEGFTGWKPERT